MKSLTYLKKAKEHFQERPSYIQADARLNTFHLGAKWMVERLNIIDPKHPKTFDPNIPFTCYGLNKYIICLLAFIASFMFFLTIHYFLTPLAVIAFYIFEVAFLFLFPLLIDGVKHPIMSSIKMTWKIGYFNAVFIVLPIALFMLIGLFDTKKPLHNWHIGCLAILFWYVDCIKKN